MIRSLILFLTVTGLGITYSILQLKHREKVDSIYKLELGVDRCLERTHYDQCLKSTQIAERASYCAKRATAIATRPTQDMRQDCK